MNLNDQNKLVKMLTDYGVRPSLQRMAVLAFMVESHRHPSAEEVYTVVSQVCPSLSLTTVYNTLSLLTKAGLLRELDIDSGMQRYDLAPQPPHSHFVCRRCGRVFDMSMPDSLGSYCHEGFAPESINLAFRGLCPDCTKKE